MSNTLQKMVEAGLAEEEELTSSEPEAELEIEADDEPEAVVAEEEEEAEIVLGDEQDAPKKELEPGLKKTLSHLRRDRRELRQEKAALSEENEALKARLDALEDATLRKPKYTDYATDEAYETALLQFHAAKSRREQPAPQAQPAAAQPQTRDFTDSVNAHYERAEKLGVNAGKFEAAERNVRSRLGDVLTDALIDAVGEGSEKAIMLIGTNAAEFDAVQSLLSSDPTGLKAVGRLNRLAERAKVTKPRVSGAPKPTRSPAGGGKVSVSALDKKLAKAEKSNDANAMFKLRREKRKAERAAASEK